MDQRLECRTRTVSFVFAFDITMALDFVLLIIFARGSGFESFSHSEG